MLQTLNLPVFLFYLGQVIMYKLKIKGYPIFKGTVDVEQGHSEGSGVLPSFYCVPGILHLGQRPN